MKPPRLPPLIARRLREFETSVYEHGHTTWNPERQARLNIEVSRRRRTLTLAIRKAIAAGK